MVILSMGVKAQENEDPIIIENPDVTIEVETPQIDIQLPEVYSRWNPNSMSREEECLAKNIYFESWKEPEQGQIAVGLVTINRLIKGGWKNSICDVVYQKGRIHRKGRIKTVAQFSWTTTWYSKHQPKNEEAYKRCIEIAKMLLANDSLFNISDFTEGATYYHAIYVHHLDKGWKHLQKITRIGLHVFFREKSIEE